MGIASGIFWIMIGLLYILYQAFKEHPSETVSGTIVFIIVFSVIMVFILTVNWLADRNIGLGVVFICVCVAAFFWYALKTKLEEDRKAAKRVAAYKERMAKVRKSMTEEDFQDYAYMHRFQMNLSMNPDDWNYWGKEPYRSKVEEHALIERSAAMRKEENEKQKTE